MRALLRGRRPAAAIGLAVVVLAAAPVAAGALAAATYREAGATAYTSIATNEAPSATASPAWNDVPGAAVWVRVPPHHRGLVSTSFNAESACLGRRPGYCATRVVKVAPGPLQELDPEGGFDDFRFDSTQGGSWEAHSMERSIVLQPGPWLLKVQRRVSHPWITFRLDETHFKAEVAVID